MLIKFLKLLKTTPPRSVPQLELPKMLVELLMVTRIKCLKKQEKAINLPMAKEEVTVQEMPKVARERRRVHPNLLSLLI